MKDRIFDVDKYDLDMCYLSILNKAKRICIHEKFIYIANREVCDANECFFKNHNLILISNNKEMTIQEINKPFLKEILKFILNNNVIDYKIISK